MKKAKTNYIVLYAEDFDTDVWEEYCKVVGVSASTPEFTIYFNEKDVKTPDEEED